MLNTNENNWRTHVELYTQLCYQLDEENKCGSLSEDCLVFRVLFIRIEFMESETKSFKRCWITCLAFRLRWFKLTRVMPWPMWISRPSDAKPSPWFEAALSPKLSTANKSLDCEVSLQEIGFARYLSRDRSLRKLICRSGYRFLWIAHNLMQTDNQEQVVSNFSSQWCSKILWEVHVLR